jgi:hypothetical protein
VSASSNSIDTREAVATDAFHRIRVVLSETGTVVYVNPDVELSAADLTVTLAYLSGLLGVTMPAAAA